MRIWDKRLIPRLCQKHLCAMWRESLGAYSIITEGKSGYRNHPATQEFINSPADLYDILSIVRDEMLKRGYHPKELPKKVNTRSTIKSWQNLKQQVEVLKNKKCKCVI